MSAHRNLDDPAQRAAYLAELRGVARTTRTAGVALATAGCGLAILRAVWLPALPALVPLTLIVTALGLLLIGIVRRVRWHWRRLRD